MKMHTIEQKHANCL